jgi:hypothetical protein
MTKQDATDRATETANRDGIVMVVTFNPYEETLDEDDKFGYFPEEALARMHRVGAFKFDKIVETIKPEPKT